MPLRIGTPLPDLSGATAWIHGEPDISQYMGKPVLVHFWSVSCPLCHENMPIIRAWQEQYAAEGLQLIAVHMPRQESDLDIARVQEDVEQMRITEPCAVDNRHAIAEAFQNEYVPAYFLFDREGKLRSRAAGYAGLALLGSALKRQFEKAEVTN